MGLERDYGYYHWRAWGPHLIIRAIQFVLIFTFLIYICITISKDYVNPAYKIIVFVVTIAAFLICFIDLITRCFRWAIPWMAWMQIALLCSLGFFLISGLGLTQLKQCLPPDECTHVKVTTILAALVALLFLIEIFYMIYWLAYKRGAILNDEKGAGDRKGEKVGHWYGNMAPCADAMGIPACGVCYVAPCADEFGVAPCGVCTTPYKVEEKRRKGKGGSRPVSSLKCTCSDPTVAMAASNMMCHCAEPVKPQPVVVKAAASARVATADADCLCTPKTMYVKGIPGSYGGTFPCEKYGAPLSSPKPTRTRAR